jgi:hypothetical protein
MSSLAGVMAGRAEVEIAAKDVTKGAFNAVKTNLFKLGALLVKYDKPVFNALSKGLGAATSAGAKLLGKIGQIEVGLGKVIAQGGRLGSVIGGGFSTLKSTAGSVVGTLASVSTGVIAVGAAILGIGAGSIATINTVGDRFDKMAMRTNGTTEGLSQLAFAADMSGTSIDAMESGMEKTSKFLAAVWDGSKEANSALEKLGMTQADLEGLSPEDAMIKLGLALSEIPDTASRTALTMQILGKSANELMPFFLAGADGIAAMREEADKLGGTVTRSQADIGAGVNDAFGRLSTATTGVLMKIGEKIGPIVIEMVNKVAFGLASIGPPIADIAHKIISIFSVVVTTFGPMFSSVKDTALTGLKGIVDNAPAFAFKLYKTYQEIVTGISQLFMKMVAAVETALLQLSSGEMLLQAQGKIADMLIDLQVATGMISEAEGKDIKQTRREDTERAATNNASIAAAREKQKKIAEDLASNLQITSDELATKLANIGIAEETFNSMLGTEEQKTFALDQALLAIRDGLLPNGATEAVAATVKEIPATLQRGTIEAARQGELNKKSNQPIVNAVNNVKEAVDYTNKTLEEKLTFANV